MIKNSHSEEPRENPDKYEVRIPAPAVYGVCQQREKQHAEQKFPHVENERQRLDEGHVERDH